MTSDPHDAPVLPDTDIHGTPAPSTPNPAPFNARELEQKRFWSVPETAYMAGVSVRSVWRELSNAKSKFPRPRRFRGRTLLVAAEVLAFLQENTAR